MDFLFSTDPLIRLQEALGRSTPTPFLLPSLLGSVWGVILVLGLARWFWGWRALGAIAFALAVEAAVRALVAHVAGIPRPQAPDLVRFGATVTSSFPSGHVATATALWWTAAALRRLPLTAAVVVSAVTALSRLYAGQHYVADVLAGTAVGLLAAWAGVTLAPRVVDWMARRSLATLVALGAALAVTFLAAAILLLPAGDVLWNAGGLVLGAVVALPASERFARYEAGAPSTRIVALRLLLGIGVLALPILPPRVVGGAPGAVNGFGTFVAAVWVFLGAPLLFRATGLAPGSPPRLGRGGRRLVRITGAAGGVLALVLAWGAGIEPRFVLDVHEETVEVPDLPESWEGGRIAAFGDLQVGMWLDNEGMMRRVAKRVSVEHPDAVLLLGDFVYHAAEDPQAELEDLSMCLEPMRESGVPVFAVLGNHDWRVAEKGDSPDSRLAELVGASLERAGVTLLRNRSVALRRNGRGDPLHLVGLGAARPKKDRPGVAFEAVPADAARVVFMHNPATFPKLPPESAPLALAGHTHGGQVRIPCTPSWSWLSFVRADPVHADGWISGFGRPGNRLYVNRGIGFGVLPLRINCPPELTIFTLRRPR